LALSGSYLSSRKGIREVELKWTFSRQLEK
jgi:hypothetical protein